MKTILVVTMCALAVAGTIGCGNKDKGGAAASGGACADAVGKGVDAMMAAGAKRMEASGGAPAEMKEAGNKMKQAMTTRCTEDKWSADVLDCYSKAASREDLKACREKLPPEQASKLQAEMMQVMAGMMGKGGPNGMGHPATLGGSAAPPAMGSDTGSAK
jgi:hypothetical protein